MNDATTTNATGAGKFDRMSLRELEAEAARVKETGKQPSSLLRKALAAARKANRPEPGKVYQLTGGPDVAAISNGSTWAESEVKDDSADRARMEAADAEIEANDVTAQYGSEEEFLAAQQPTAAERLAAEREARIAAARAEIDAADAARAAQAPACGTDGRVPDLSLRSTRKAREAELAEARSEARVEATIAEADEAPVFAPDEPAEAPKPPKAPKGKPAKATPKKATKAQAPKPAPGRKPKAQKPAGDAPAWQADAAKVAANPIQGGVVLALLKNAGPLTDPQVAERLSKSHAWTNRTTLSLEFVGLTVRERDGRSIVNRLP